MLTCTGGLSRSRRVGLALGQGQQLDAILKGWAWSPRASTTPLSAHRLAQREGVEMPITAMMHAILYENSVRAAVDALMQRDLKAERD